MNSKTTTKIKNQRMMIIMFNVDENKQTRETATETKPHKSND